MIYGPVLFYIHILPCDFPTDWSERTGGKTLACNRFMYRPCGILPNLQRSPEQTMVLKLAVLKLDVILCNSSLERARVIIIPKSGKARHEVISLLHIPSKLFEKLLLTQLNRWTIDPHYWSTNIIQKTLKTLLHNLPWCGTSIWYTIPQIIKA